MGQEERTNTRNVSLVEKMDKIMEDMNNLKGESKKGKEKKFTFKKSKSKLKKNYVMYFFVHTNKHAEIKYLPIVDNAVYIKEKDMYYPVTSEFIFWFNNYPMIIQHEDQVMPLHPETLSGKNPDTLAIGQKILFALMKKAQIKDEKKKANWGALIIVIGVIAVIAVVILLLKKKA
jgi:hypothetical protein